MPNPALTDDTLSKTLEELYGRINYERQIKVSEYEFRLNNMRDLLRRLGSPQSDYPAIHVAGTKGKGSVATMTGSILTASGFQVGVYTSPHLEKINQRMAINGQVISDTQLLKVLTQMRPAIEKMDQEATQPSGDKLTFFEITTAAAMLFFAQQAVDYAVIEVGLGGRLDSTNVCEPAVCVITNISLDHTRQLGNTTDKIARAKAGIIKPNVPVVSGTIDPAAAAAISEVASNQSASLVQLEQDFSVELPNKKSPDGRPDASSATFDVTGVLNQTPLDVTGIELRLPGSHQRTNAALAVAAVSLLDDAQNRITPDSIRTGLAKTTLPGRTEVVSTDPLVILDIAHNPASAAALAKTLKTEIPAWQSARRRTIIFATSRDKDAAAMLAALADCCDRVVLTEYQSNPRALKLANLIELTKTSPQLTDAYSNVALDSSPNPQSALKSILAESAPDDAICITGSAFLVAEVRSDLRD